MPRFDPASVEENNRTLYPADHAAPLADRWVRRLGPATKLEDFGASLVRLEPGAWSSQRHWHEGEDELVVMLEGEAVLIEEGERTLLRAGDIATFPKGVANGHHLVNESDRPCRFLAVGRPVGQYDAHYPDIDMHFDGASGRFTRKDKSAFQAGSGS